MLNRSFIVLSANIQNLYISAKKIPPFFFVSPYCKTYPFAAQKSPFCKAKGALLEGDARSLCTHRHFTTFFRPFCMTMPL
jgi:hypothetical protein